MADVRLTLGYWTLTPKELVNEDTVPAWYDPEEGVIEILMGMGENPYDYNLEWLADKGMDIILLEGTHSSVYFQNESFWSTWAPASYKYNYKYDD